MSKTRVGKKLSEKHKLAISNGKKGKNWNWKGGISKVYKTGYWTKKYKDWRNKVFKRDNWTCEICNIRGGRLEAHHLKSFTYFPKDRFIVSNGITLCYNCHKKEHKENK